MKARIKAGLLGGYCQKGGFCMRKMFFVIWICLLSSSITWSQEKIDAPVWNVGDKWVFTQGNIEVIGADKKSYALNFSKDTCFVENVDFETIIFDKSTMNRSYVLKEEKREKYVMALSKILDFPLSVGKQWSSAYSSTMILTHSGVRMIYDYSEFYKILGWDDVKVRAGEFKALRLEYKRVRTGTSAARITFVEAINEYWYSPDAKYFVKCQYDKDWMKQDKQIFNWELISFQLKK